MTILLGRYEFDGPYKTTSDLNEMPGLYVVLHCADDEYELIHVAESHNIKESIEFTSRSERASGSSVMIAALYTPHSKARERRIMVEEILSEFNDEHFQECEDQQLTSQM